MDGYLVRTKSGDKGPFDVFQLMKLVEAGKLPRTAQVIDAENDLAIPLEDLLPDPVEPAPPPVEAPVREEPAPPPPPPPPARTAAPRAPQRAPRGARHGVGQKGRDAVASRRPAARPVPGGAPHRAHRYTGFEHKKSRLAPILLTIVVVAVIGGGGGYILWRDTDRSLEGQWSFDLDTFLEAEMEASGKSLSPAQRELAENLMRTVFEGSGVTFGESTITAHLGDQKLSGTYRVVSRSDNHYRIEIEEAGTAEVSRADLTIRGRRMFWKDLEDPRQPTAAILIKR